MLLAAIIIISLAVRIWYVLQPATIWWDTAVYASMGKYLMTGGRLGFIEQFRPPLFPLFMGTLWKLHLDPILWGKIFEIIASAASVYLAYRIGEKIKKGSGIYAAILLSFSPLFLYFTNIPLTDIPSLFFILLSCLYALEHKEFKSGLSLACAFLLRFPQGLMLVPLSLIMLPNRQKLAKLYAGFIIPLIPYLAISWEIFGNPLRPILQADQVAAASYGVQGSVFYYVFMLAYQNIFLILALIFLAVLAVKLKSNFKETLHDKPAMLMTLSLIIVGSYFSAIAHKEFRYGLAFLPYLSILAGAGIAILAQRSKLRAIPYIISGALIAALVSMSAYARAAYPANTQELSPEYQAFYTLLKDKPGARIITTSPQISAVTDTKTLQLFENWNDLAWQYEAYKNNLDYILIDSCRMNRVPDASAEDSTRKALDAHSQKAFDEKTGQCELIIYSQR